MSVRSKYLTRCRRSFRRRCRRSFRRRCRRSFRRRYRRRLGSCRDSRNLLKRKRI